MTLHPLSLELILVLKNRMYRVQEHVRKYTGISKTLKWHTFCFIFTFFFHSTRSWPVLQRQNVRTDVYRMSPPTSAFNQAVCDYCVGAESCDNREKLWLMWWFLGPESGGCTVQLHCTVRWRCVQAAMICPWSRLSLHSQRPKRSHLWQQGCGNLWACSPPERWPFQKKTCPAHH